MINHPAIEAVIGGAAVVPLILKVTGVLTIASSGIAAIVAISALALAGIALMIHALCRAFTKKTVKELGKNQRFEGVSPTRSLSLQKRATNQAMQPASDSQSPPRIGTASSSNANTGTLSSCSPLDVLLEARDNLADGPEKEKLNTLCDEHFRKSPLTLHNAIAQYPNNLKLIQWLVQEKEVNVHSSYSFSSTTPLHFAARYGSMEIVRFLLDQGACMEGRDDSFRTPISCAIQSRRLEIVVFLLERGATIDTDAQCCLINYVNNSSQKIEILQCLAPLDLPLRVKKTFLLLAIQNQHYDLVQLLAHKEALTDTHVLFEIPLVEAVKTGNAPIIELLLQRGANPCFHEDTPPLHIAVKMKRPDIIELLLKHNANVNARKYNGQTPLHWAIQSKNDAAIALLLQHGANVDAQDTLNRTPLHWAIPFKNDAAIALLLQHGANVDAQDMQGLTPLCWAVLSKNDTAIALLLPHVADVDAHPLYGFTPLYYAIYIRNCSAISLLVAARADFSWVKTAFPALPEDVCTAIAEAYYALPRTIDSVLGTLPSFKWDNRDATTTPFTNIITAYLTSQSESDIPQWGAVDSPETRQNREREMLSWCPGLSALLKKAAKEEACSNSEIVSKD